MLRFVLSKNTIRELKKKSSTTVVLPELKNMTSINFRTLFVIKCPNRLHYGIIISNQHINLVPFVNL